MGFFFFFFFRGEAGGRLPDWLSRVDKHVLCLWAKYSWADDMVQVAKNEMWVSELFFACLTWLYRLFVRTLISLTNA